MPRGVPDSKEHLVTIDNNALWRNPRVLVRLLVCCLQRFHVIEGIIILLVLCRCDCVYICFFSANMMYMGCVQVCAHAFA